MTMQIIRSSRECKWIKACDYCGCVYVYKGDEVEEAELPDLKKMYIKAIAKPEDKEQETRHICQVMCPECHQYSQVAMMARDRKPAYNAEEWGMDEYAGC